MTRPATLLLVSGFSDQQLGMLAPPAGLYKLLAYVSARGIKADILNCDLEDPAPYLERAEAGEFDIVGFGVTHWTLVEDLARVWAFRRALARSGKPSMILGGGFAGTLNYRQWLRMGIDLILPGYAEQRLTRLCEVLHLPPLTSDGEFDVPAIAANLDGSIHLPVGGGDPVLVPAPPMKADEFRQLFFTELMDNDRIPFSRYWEVLRANRADATPSSAAGFVVEAVRLFTTSRCSQNCGFCCSPGFVGESVRGTQSIIMLSAEECVALTLKYVRELGARCVMFSDDDFPTGNASGLLRVREFCERIIALKQAGELPADLRFGAQTRVRDFLSIHPDGRREANHDLLRLMAKAGFNGVSMGVETFSDRILHMPSVNKVGVTVADCLTVIDAMQDAGMVPQVNLILGIPEYTVEELVDTISTAYRLLRRNCDVALNGAMLAFPGTLVHDSAEYAKTYKDWVHPETGERFAIVQTAIPNDAVVAAMIGRLDDEGRAVRDEMLSRFGCQPRFVHRRVSALANFSAAARLLGADDLADAFYSFLEDEVSATVAMVPVSLTA